MDYLRSRGPSASKSVEKRPKMPNESALFETVSQRKKREAKERMNKEVFVNKENCLISGLNLV